MGAEPDDAFYKEPTNGLDLYREIQGANPGLTINEVQLVMRATHAEVIKVFPQPPVVAAKTITNDSSSEASSSVEVTNSFVSTASESISKRKLGRSGA